MKNVRVYFEIYEGNVEYLPPRYQEVSCHIIFGVNMGNNFCRKYQIVSVGNNTPTPSFLTYLSVVSQDSVRISLTIYVLNYLNVLACDIPNLYIAANFRDKIWTVSGPEFG